MSYTPVRLTHGKLILTLTFDDNVVQVPLQAVTGPVAWVIPVHYESRQAAEKAFYEKHGKFVEGVGYTFSGHRLLHSGHITYGTTWTDTIAMSWPASDGGHWLAML